MSDQEQRVDKGDTKTLHIHFARVIICDAQIPVPATTTLEEARILAHEFDESGVLNFTVDHKTEYVETDTITDYDAIWNVDLDGKDVYNDEEDGDVEENNEAAEESAP